MKQNIMKGVKRWSPCSHGCKCFPKQYLIRDHPPTERSFYTHLFLFDRIFDSFYSFFIIIWNKNIIGLFYIIFIFRSIYYLKVILLFLEQYEIKIVDATINSMLIFNISKAFNTFKLFLIIY